MPRCCSGSSGSPRTSRVVFGREHSGLAFSPAVVALPTGTEDPRLLATADALAESALRARPPSADFTAGVARRIEQELAQGEVQAASIARALRLSPRTLQRRLTAEGTSFKDLLESVRRDLAGRWVSETALPLAEIAYRLGYSDVAAFSRAFKRWTGKSPGAARRAPERA